MDKLKIDITDHFRQQFHDYMESNVTPLVIATVHNYLDDQPSEFYSINEACDYLKISRPTLRYYTRNKHMESIKVSGRTYYKGEALKNFQKSGQLNKKRNENN